MYHGRFNGTHYEIGLKWGGLLLKNGKKLLDGVPFPITEEVLEEIEGIAAGQKIASEKLMAVLLSMYCIMPEQKCSCVAFKNENHIILARNSDFLTEIEKLYMNCIYKIKKPAAFGPPYSFQGNTTAFVEMEPGTVRHCAGIYRSFKGASDCLEPDLHRSRQAGQCCRHRM